jgi:hypothetical protein
LKGGIEKGETLEWVKIVTKFKNEKNLSTYKIDDDDEGYPDDRKFLKYASDMAKNNNF